MNSMSLPTSLYYVAARRCRAKIAAPAPTVDTLVVLLAARWSAASATARAAACLASASRRASSAAAVVGRGWAEPAPSVGTGAPKTSGRWWGRGGSRRCSGRRSGGGTEADRVCRAEGRRLGSAHEFRHFREYLRHAFLRLFGAL